MTPDGFHPAGPADVQPGRSARREAAGAAVIVARADDGRWFACAAVCPHALLPLEGARVRGRALVCPHHGARFDLASGRALGPPAFAPLAVYPARERDGQLEVALS